MVRVNRTADVINELHFKVEAPFDRVGNALDRLGAVTILETSELHVLGRLSSGHGIIARPAFPDSVDVIVVGEADDHEQVALEFSTMLGQLLECEVGEPGPLPSDLV